MALGLQMAGSAEALLKLLPSATKPGGMRSGFVIRRRGGPKKQPDSHECTSTGNKISSSSAATMYANILKQV